MIPRASTAGSQALRALQPIRARSINALRWSSSSTQPSPTGNFYKTFARPVAKCLLTAVLTYQLIYLGWVKLEAEEVKAERKGEISKLEAQVKNLQQSLEKK